MGAGFHHNRARNLLKEWILALRRRLRCIQIVDLARSAYLMQEPAKTAHYLVFVFHFAFPKDNYLPTHCR